MGRLAQTLEGAGTDMSLPPIDAHANAAFKRFYTLLPRTNDEILLILKLHLLVEEQIRTFVDERLADPSALGKAKFDCHAVICIAEALCSEDIHPNIWEASRKLNSLRNQIAHNLEPKGIHDRMLDICRLVGLPATPKEQREPDGKPTPLDDFSFAVSLLFNEISLFVKRKPANVIHLVHSEGAP